MDKHLAAPCGLYCGACGVYIATTEKNEKIREKFSKAFMAPLDQTKCLGCMTDNPDDIFYFCKVCPIKKCAKEKNIEGCFQCDDFPCAFIDNFPILEAKKVILQSVPRWKRLGTEQWLQEEAKRYQCPSCKTAQYRGAKFCRTCTSPVQTL